MNDYKEIEREEFGQILKKHPEFFVEHFTMSTPGETRYWANKDAFESAAFKRIKPWLKIEYWFDQKELNAKTIPKYYKLKDVEGLL